MAAAVAERLSFLSLEITGKCQLACTHCYAESGPTGTHGIMTAADWMRVMDEAVELGAWHVGFVGGEPTLHPDLSRLVDHALMAGLQVEVFSNLVRVTGAMWDVFDRPGVALGTSYYSSDPDEHNAITLRRSHGRTLANIREATRRGIPLRVGMVRVDRGQQVDAGAAELRSHGVERIGIDDLREIGRGVRGSGQDIDQLCGRCGSERVAVGPDGGVRPCLMSRWIHLGNVRRSSLQEVFAASCEARAELVERLASLADEKCNPDKCTPDRCQPDKCLPDKCNPESSDGGCSAPTCLPHY
jgi:MoaA/NifB/PqqE/SkfB family radical SAM enzyme